MGKNQWNKEEKALAVEEYLKTGDPLRVYAKALGISGSTLGKWVQDSKRSREEEKSGLSFIELVSPSSNLFHSSNPASTNPSPPGQNLEKIEILLGPQITIKMGLVSPQTLLILMKGLKAC